MANKFLPGASLSCSRAETKKSREKYKDDSRLRDDSQSGGMRIGA